MWPSKQVRFYPNKATATQVKNIRDVSKKIRYVGII